MKLRPLRSQVSWTFDFSHPIERVWEYVRDTDRMNRARIQPPVEYREEPSSSGGSRRFGSMVTQGVRLDWEEQPYEWVRHRFFLVRRSYTRGPFLDMDVYWEFLPTGQDGRSCRLIQTIHYTARNAFWKAVLALQLPTLIRAEFTQAYERIEGFLKGESETAFVSVSGDRFEATPAWSHAFRSRMRGVGAAEETTEALMRFVSTAQQADLIRIRPFALAKRLGIERMELLGALLKGTKAGVFRLYWDLICPSCKGSKNGVPSLSDIRKEAHCESCNIDFTVDLESSVELSFKVSPAVREVGIGRYCIGGPGNTPHILAQQSIEPGHAIELEIELSPGLYRFRSPQSKRAQLLRVLPGTGSGEEIRVDLSRDEPEMSHLARAGQVLVEAPSSNAEPLLLVLEHADWFSDACSASYMSTCQEFHDLFSSEVLRPGEDVGVGAMAILFTDLKGSTALYNRVGDARAYRLVRDHFDILKKCVSSRRGAIVKTIGDAVMASFLRPTDALSCAFAMHEEMEREHSGSEEQLKLKVGIHYGPCLAVDQNDRLDYFGTAVNLAARVQGESEGGDVVLSREMLDEPGVREELRRRELLIEPFRCSVRGFEEEMELFRIRADLPEIGGILTAEKSLGNSEAPFVWQSNVY